MQMGSGQMGKTPAQSHNFSNVPKAEIQRSSFDRSSSHKTTFDSAYLVPIYWDECLPGDTHKVSATSFCRLSTPIRPIMDNMYMDMHFFFVPLRLIWANFKKFMGEQVNPGDSISYLCPTMTSPTAGPTVGSLSDYFGIPTVGQIGGGNTITFDSFLHRAYNLIYNEYYRDENLINSVTVDTGDGPDTYANYVLLKSGKRFDYFTSALPWAQKGSAVTLPLGSTAPVTYTGTEGVATAPGVVSTLSGHVRALKANGVTTYVDNVDATAGYGLYADLSSATSATINALRQAFQIQRLLERDARGGTRYTEIVLSHFQVSSPDARLQRPEYLGGGTNNVNIYPLPQTTGTGASGTTTPQGNLAAMGISANRGVGFTKSFTEHGVILGIARVRADLHYQQGLNRMFKRQTRYDFYWPALSHIGEQTILNSEIYCDGSGNDTGVFGYAERYAEYRYKPSIITGKFRSTASGTLDSWHLAQKFSSLPTLGSTFITEAPPIDRVVAVNTEPQFTCDFFFKQTSTRPMPLYGVPGFVDRF